MVVAVSNRDLDNGRQGTTGVAFSGQHRHVSQPERPGPTVDLRASIIIAAARNDPEAEMRVLTLAVTFI